MQPYHEHAAVLGFFVTSKACYGTIQLDSGDRIKSKINLLDETTLENRTQGSMLIPFLQKLWMDAEKPRIRSIIVPNGPGSFTSVRITLAAALGLQLGFSSFDRDGMQGPSLKTPTFFDVLLYNQKTPAFAVIDSKRGDFFVAMKTSDELEIEPKILSAIEFEAFLKDHPSPTWSSYYDPELWKTFEGVSFDEMTLLDALIALEPKVKACDEVAPYYLFEPAYKKTK